MNQDKSDIEWEIPESHDLGIPYYYRNVLSGNAYVQKYLHTYVAVIDRKISKYFDYEKEKQIEGVPAPTNGTDISVADVKDALFCAGVPRYLLRQMSDFLEHVRSRSEDSVDFRTVKELFAYCGIEGVYDLDGRRHFKVETNVKQLPEAVHTGWIGSTTQDIVRKKIALMMAEPGEIFDPHPEIKELQPIFIRRYNEGYAAYSADQLAKGLPATPEGFPIEQYVEGAAEYNSTYDALIAKQTASIDSAMEKYAPLDPSAYPVLDPKFDKRWADSFEQFKYNEDELQKTYEDSLAADGIKPGDSNFVRFPYNEIRNRYSSIKDWVLKDFTLSKRNRGVMADAARIDIPINFVKAVKKELKDGLLSRIKAPYRIEPVEGVEGEYYLIGNNMKTGSFNLSSLDNITNIGVRAELSQAKREERRKERLARMQKVAEPEATPEGNDTLTPPNYDGDPMDYSSYGDSINFDEPVSESPISDEIAYQSEPSSSGAGDDVAVYLSEAPAPAPAPALELDPEPSKARSRASGRSKSPTSDTAPAEPSIGIQDQVEGVTQSAPGNSTSGAADLVVKKTIRSWTDYDRTLNKGDKSSEPEAKGKTPSGRALNLSSPPDKSKSMGELKQSLTSEGARPGQFSGGYGRNYGGGGGGVPVGSDIFAGIANFTKLIGKGFSYPFRAANQVVTNSDHIKDAVDFKVDKIVSCRKALAAGVDKEGRPLSAESISKTWGDLTRTMGSLKHDITRARHLTGLAFKRSLGDSILRADKEVTATKNGLIDTWSSQNGLAGELAASAELQANDLQATIKSLIAAFLKIFSRHKVSDEPKP